MVLRAVLTSSAPETVVWLCVWALYSSDCCGPAKNSEIFRYTLLYLSIELPRFFVQPVYLMTDGEPPRRRAR